MTQEAAAQNMKNQLKPSFKNKEAGRTQEDTNARTNLPGPSKTISR
jgi:hypothetical protein